MSDRLRPVPGKKVVKALEQRGWYVKRVRGSHHVMRHPTIPDAVPVPVHAGQAVPVGTLVNVLRTAGISRDEFLKLLE